MGAQFHKDIHQAPGAAAGTYPLYDPGGRPVLITHVSFTTDTAQRFVVGLADIDDERLLAGEASLGELRDLRLHTGETGLVGPIVVITTLASGFDAMIEGCELP